MVDKQPLADDGAGMNFDPRFVPGTLADPPGQKIVAALLQPVAFSIGAHRFKSRIEEVNLPSVPGRRVPRDNRVQLLL